MRKMSESQMIYEADQKNFPIIVAIVAVLAIVVIIQYIYEGYEIRKEKEEEQRRQILGLTQENKQLRQEAKEQRLAAERYKRRIDSINYWTAEKAGFSDEVLEILKPDEGFKFTADTIKGKKRK